jgi:hypothetical protein
MWHLFTTTALAAFAAFCTPTWAINKCTSPDGKVAFQDAACPGKGEKLEVRPATGTSPTSMLTSGVARTPAQAGEGIAKKQTEADRINALTAASQRDRRKVELNERLVPYAKAAIGNELKQCDAQLKALQAKKRSANNNLAGATWEGSISSEMTAIATRCDTRTRDLREEFATLKKECVLLGACNSE